MKFKSSTTSEKQTITLTVTATAAEGGIFFLDRRLIDGNGKVHWLNTPKNSKGQQWIMLSPEKEK